MPENRESIADESTKLAQLAVDYTFSILTLPTAKEEEGIPTELAILNRIQDMHSLLWSIRNMASSLSKGDLDYTTREKGFVVGSLKAFQSNLRHLTWQAQRIAGGDYNQTVTFMGEFATAFNKMAEQLANRFDILSSQKEEYKERSFRDQLTGLYNRAAFMVLSKQVLAQLISSPSCLIMADIDHFKKFNDTYGHLCGDEVLRSFARTLTATLRPTDICSRYGGEEFLMLMPGASLKDGMKVGERLREAVEITIVEFEGKKMQVTASFGLILVPPMPEEQQFEDYLCAYIEKADQNLYSAKKQGRNMVIGSAKVQPTEDNIPHPKINTV